MSVIDRVEQLAIPAERRRFQVVDSQWRAWEGRYRLAAIGSDVMCALAVCLALGHYVLGNAVGAAVVGVLTFVGTVAATGGYEVRYVAPAAREYRSIALGFVAMLVVAMAVSFLELAELPPAPVVLGIGGVVAAAALFRTAQRRLLSSLRARGLHRPRAIVVGPVDHTERLLEDMSLVREDLELVGACVPEREVGSTLPGGVEVLGSPRDATVLADVNAADVVLVADGALPADEFRRFQWAMERTETELVVVPDLREVLESRVDLQVVGTTPVMTVLRPTTSQRLAKQVMDRVLGTLLLVAFSPVILGAMAAVRLTSPGPAIFRQVRVGRDGREFTILKLRTMYTDAERRREELLAANEGAGPLFKMVDDPRVTTVGRVLRRFSIDELPQLWNVVRGDMSLVGPRPALPSEVATYDVMAMHRLHVRPGMTGLWQVSGRSRLSWDQTVKLDLRYADNWSIGFDLKILWRTARAVLGADGAY